MEYCLRELLLEYSKQRECRKKISHSGQFAKEDRMNRGRRFRGEECTSKPEDMNQESQQQRPGMLFV